MGRRRRRRSSTCSNGSASSRGEWRGGGEVVSGAVVAFVEHAAGEPDRLSLEALALARALAKQLDVPLDAVTLGTHAEAAATRLGSQGVGLAHVATDARLADYAPAAWATSIRD